MSAIAPTYAPQKMHIVKGQGAWLYDDQGQPYLDFASGVAVTSLGHNHPALTQALQDQIGALLHVSNLYGISSQQALAESLTARSFAEAVFFCNSGAEAMEGCLKFARRYHWHQGQTEKIEFISFAGAFHGRTLATIAAGGNLKYGEGFGPSAPEFHQVAFDDLAAAAALIGPKTAAIVVEPIQGEGGIRPQSIEFMQQLRALADAHGVLLILDEVQTGVGRTGYFWAHEAYGIKPDLLASAKGLGGGVPIGAVLMTQEIAACLRPGIHGSTFGGNPLAMAAGLAVVKTIDQAAFLENVKEQGRYLSAGLEHLTRGGNRVLAGHRGLGLMQGVQVHAEIDVADLVEASRQAGLLTVPAGNQTLRLLPPLTVTKAEIDQALSRLEKASKSL